jgi:protein-L-isoaspartate O-methyltransferase
LSWQEHAQRLAGQVTHRGSRWHGPVARSPRHLLVPRWWDRAGTGDWALYDGPSSEPDWMAAAYGDQTLITSVGGLHADQAGPGDRPSGVPTSSSTLPGLAVRMLRHAQVYDGADVLDVATGPGYSAALLSHRLGAHHVTSIDIDPYLTRAAAGRLGELGLAPKLITGDATGPLPGSYDRIVSMTSVRPIPASWLAALRPGGRLVTVIARTALIITADKADGGNWAAIGRVEWDRAMFMAARTSAGPPPPGGGSWPDGDGLAGGQASTGRYPVVDVAASWELASMLEVTAPGIEHRYHEDPGGPRTALMRHPDGSWATARAASASEAPTVRQGGPRRLWDILDDLREYWLRHGYFQLYGATALISAKGTIHLIRGQWRATISS